MTSPVSAPEAPQVRPTSAGLRRFWPFLPLLLASLYLAAVAAGLTPLRVLYEYTLTPIEPQAVAGALRVARGEPLYQDYRSGLPVIPITYGALTYVLPGMAARLLGRSDALTVLHLGRSVSLLAAAAMPFVLLWLCRQRGMAWRWAWISLLPLVWFPRLAENWSKFLPHHAALACSLLGWALSSSAASSSGLRRAGQAFGALAAWTAGFLLHPTVVVGPVAAGVEWLFRKRSSPPEATEAGAFRVGILIAWPVCAGAAAWLLNTRTGGLWYLNTVEAMKVCRYDPAFTVTDLSHLMTSGWLLLSGMALTAAILWRRSPLFPAWLGALILELLLMTKQGSSSTYLAGSVTLWGVAAAVALSRACEPGIRETALLPGWRRPLFTPLLLLTAGALAALPQASRVAWEIPLPDQRELRNVDQALARLAPRSLLVLDAFYAQSRRYPYPYADPYHAALLSAHGKTDLSAAVEGLRTGRHDYVVTNLFHLGPTSYHDAPAAPPEIRSALQENYTVLAAGRWLALCRKKGTGNP